MTLRRSWKSFATRHDREPFEESMKRPASLLCEPQAEERKESRIRELDLLVLPRDLLEQGLHRPLKSSADTGGLVK